MGIAIHVDGLSKQYRIGGVRDRYDTLRDHLARKVRRRTVGGAGHRTIWALEDVSFDVPEGQVLGVIGPNGAGKTTLLRLLSRITQPTAGRAEIRGRVGSLLEVGTGFHPELTGRENVFLNGAVLGMQRKEIARKFDEIVDFSGVEEFIDTPVKRYSTGMQVRLAFAVAAHLEPEILLVDEVLAVGDVEFQRRCIGKMESIGASGRTVLFVSHSMPTVARLCERAILLRSGRLQEDGPATDVVAAYLSGVHGSAAERSWDLDTEAPGGENATLRRVRVVDRAGVTRDSFDIREEVGIQLDFDILRPTMLVPWIALYDGLGGHIFSAMDTNERWRASQAAGTFTSTAWIPGNLLNEGPTIVNVSLTTLVSGGKSIRQAYAENAVSFQVFDPGEGDTARGDYGGTWTAPVRPLLEWETTLEHEDLRFA